MKIRPMDKPAQTTKVSQNIVANSNWVSMVMRRTAAGPLVCLESLGETKVDRSASDFFEVGERMVANEVQMDTEHVLREGGRRFAGGLHEARRAYCRWSNKYFDLDFRTPHFWK